MLKYLTVTPVVLMFIVTTNPSEFAASLNKLGIRGIEMSSKTSLWNRLKKMSMIISPLLFSSMDRIDVVSNAMELRGFGKHK